MKKIAFNNMYRDYWNNNLFDVSKCAIGENILQPNIDFKAELTKLGYEVNTMDLVKLKEQEYLIFQDIPMDSYISNKSPMFRIKHLIRGRYKEDFLFLAAKMRLKNKMILLALEPPIINRFSYDEGIHKLFDKILTWQDDLVDNKKYFKLNYPQPEPKDKYFVEFKKKKFCTLIASNKVSNDPRELYSERANAIDYFERHAEFEFDLYGFGWDKNLKNYKGTVDRKLQTMSQYKYCVCYENMTDINGYITEKIFDAFRANCIPIYWGATNIDSFIPNNTFIDRRNFKSFEDLIKHIQNISEEEYNIYLKNIQQYLLSDSFKNQFSTEAYIKTIKDVLNIR